MIGLSVYELVIQDCFPEGRPPPVMHPVLVFQENGVFFLKNNCAHVHASD